MHRNDNFINLFYSKIIELDCFERVGNFLVSSNLCKRDIKLFRVLRKIGRTLVVKRALRIDKLIIDVRIFLFNALKVVKSNSKSVFRKKIQSKTLNILNVHRHCRSLKRGAAFLYWLFFEKFCDFFIA